MKFILVAPLSVVGGITTWTRYFLNGCDRGRVEPVVIDNAKGYEEIGKRSNLRGMVLGLLKAGILAFRLGRAIVRERPKMVFLTCSGYWSFFTRDLLLVSVSRWLGVKPLIHLRGGNPSAWFGHSPLSHWLSRQVMGQAHKIVVITRSLETRARALYPEKTMYLPNMLDGEILKLVNRRVRAPGDASIKALHVAHQIPAKGSFEIIEACALLKEKLPGFTCDLVGKGSAEDMAAIGERIARLGLQETVRMHGEITGPGKWDFFNAADFFVFPSHSEGFPNVILEAMCFELPIIATDVGNIREMIGWKTTEEAGVLLETLNPISVDELALAMARLAGDELLRKRLGANGKARVREKYLTTAVIPMLESLILEMPS